MQRRARTQPSGCWDSIIITRLIIGIVLVPTLILVGAAVAIFVVFYALHYSPFLGLLAILLCIGILAGAARWEARRVARDMPPDEDDN